MKTAYFHIMDSRVVDDKTVLSGNYILADTVEVPKGGGGTAPSGTLPGIRVPGPFKVKWILGPNGEGKAEAEAMGYETVALDDFSYPPPR